MRNLWSLFFFDTFAIKLFCTQNSVRKKLKRFFFVRNLLWQILWLICILNYNSTFNEGIDEAHDRDQMRINMSIKCKRTVEPSRQFPGDGYRHKPIKRRRDVWRWQWKSVLNWNIISSTSHSIYDYLRERLKYLELKGEIVFIRRSPSEIKVCNKILKTNSLLKPHEKCLILS